jgi:hypothetical protein
LMASPALLPAEGSSPYGSTKKEGLLVRQPPAMRPVSAIFTPYGEEIESTIAPILRALDDPYYEIPGELLDSLDATLVGGFGKIPALEFLEHDPS